MAIENDIARLSHAQKAALRLMQPGVRRTAHPEINPRTAASLWSKGLLKGEIIGAERFYILTASGEDAKRALHL